MINFMKKWSTLCIKTDQLYAQKTDQFMHKKRINFMHKILINFMHKKTDQLP